VPNDEYYQPNATFPLGQYWIKLTRTDYAWALVGYTLGQQDVSTAPDRTIAIIDTGTDPDHPDFIIHPAQIPPHVFHHGSRSFYDGASSPGIPFCECDPNVLPLNNIEDLLWIASGIPGANPHGTIESGLIGAVADNAIGMAGICWDCSLLIERVLLAADIGGCIMACFSTDENIADAIKYAAGYNFMSELYPDNSVLARTVSIAALGNYPQAQWCDSSNVLKLAIEEAANRNCIIVAIAGNDTNNNGVDNEPMNSGLAIHPDTITVGGCDMDGIWATPISRSNPECIELCETTCNLLYTAMQTHVDPYNGKTYVKALSVVAPIDDIFSTWYIHPDNNNVAYDYPGSGTSWAAPQVAGVVALMLRVYPNLTPKECKKVIEQTATDLYQMSGDVILYGGYDRFTGYGLLNAEAAVEKAILLNDPSDWNGDGSVGPIDPVLFVADLAAGDPMADLNLDETQSSDDLAIYLDSYAGN
jgi:subtilisin family serine protease